MSLSMRLVRLAGAVALAVAMLTVPAAPAAAQDSPNEGAISVSGGIDFLNAYFFRGIYQSADSEGDHGVVMWPYVDVGATLYEADSGVTGVSVNLGSWNSLHTGDTGSGGPSEQLWYESDFYASLGLDFQGGFSVGTTYTAYNSPNGSFGTVKEIAFSIGYDDSELLGAATVSPYVLFAFELDGQADGGGEEGTYMEIGFEPGYSAQYVSLTVPIKLGFSLSNYYELEDDITVPVFPPPAPTYTDNAFGYFSIGVSLGVPLTSGPTRFGEWDIHGGVEFLTLGETTEAFYGDGSKVIGSFGIGFSY